MKSSYAYFEEDFDMLKATNDYINKTKWGKKNKVLNLIIFFNNIIYL